MSNLTDILTGRANINRRTAFVLDEVVPAATLNPDRNPAKASRLVVKVAGATVLSGLVNVNGNVAETFNFSENGVVVGSKDFSSIATNGVTISGIEGGSISIKAVSRTGQENTQEERIYSDLPVRFYVKRETGNTIVMKPQGQESMMKYKMLVGPDYEIKANDIVYAVSGVIGLTRGVVEFAQMFYDFAGASHHLECRFKDV